MLPLISYSHIFGVLGLRGQALVAGAATQVAAVQRHYPLHLGKSKHNWILSEIFFYHFIILLNFCL